jgi:hypothetical protein
MPRVVNMDFGIDKAKVQQYKALAVKFLGHPAKMRVVLLAAMTGLAVGAIYLPLSDKTAQQRVLIAAEKKRLDCIREVEGLRQQAKQYVSRIDAKSDTNEWVRYLLDGCRQARVRLRDMESKEPRKVGPYKAVTLVLEVQGQYPHLKQFLEWLDLSERLLRVDAIRVEKLPDAVIMKVQVLGLVGKRA